MKSPDHVTIAKAKGRPMLTWVGKRSLARVTAYPAQAIERFDADPDQALPLADTDWSGWPADLPRGGLLYHGDNKDVLAHLLANGFRGKVKLIYIDPPFDSGADYVRKVQLRGAKGTVKIDGEDYTLGEQIQYRDIWANDNYLQFMYERLLMLKELLAPEGTLWIHCDYRRSHHLRCLGEEVFGGEKLINEIIWKRAAPRGNVSMGLSVATDSILVLSPSEEPEWHPPKLPYTDEYLARFTQVDQEGRRYTLDNMVNPNPNRPSLTYEWNGVVRVWRVCKEKMQELHDAGKLQYTSNGVARYKRYQDELGGQPLTTLWDDIQPVNSQADERANYPTQKPEKLLERIITTTTSQGDLILDCFIGSGSTAAVAQKLGRRWIGCDINKGAIQTTAKRLQALMREQAATLADRRQLELLEQPDAAPGPCQLGFGVWRVNDYDLQIQHNEAVELACQHLGVTRTRADGFFDGTQGNRLVKIIPFNHPLTPLDLEDIRRELKTRPEEERDIVVVSLGLQHDARQWLEDYNRNRPVNKLHLIELRGDRKFGGFIRHEPLTAEASVTRTGDRIVVEITDVISPTILQRLNLEQGLFRAEVADWRAVVDCVLIDAHHDGQLLNITLSDVPDRKQDLVQGRYDLPAPPPGSTVAVKIIDMLGEELTLSFQP
jgi:DNA modification methylase